MFGKSCEELSLNHLTSTPHRSETNGIAERAVRRIKEGTSKMVGWFYGMLMLTAKRPRHPGGWETLLQKTFGRIIEGTDHSVRSNGWVSSDFSQRSIQTPPIWQESSTRKIAGICLDFEESLGRRHSDRGSGRVGKDGRSRDLPKKSQCERSIDISKGEEFIFPKADDTAKLSGRDHEFREPTPRREQTVRRENLSGESHGDREEIQPEESKDDAEKSQGLLAHWRRFHLSLSHWTEGSIKCAWRIVHSLFHWSILMSPGHFIQIWTLHKNNELTITGMSMKTEVCQIRGQVSQDLRY